MTVPKHFMSLAKMITWSLNFRNQMVDKMITKQTIGDILREIAADLKKSNDEAKLVSQSDRDYNELQAMIRRHGVCNVVSMLSQACGNITSEYEDAAEDYAIAEEIIGAASVGVDLYYDRDTEHMRAATREQAYENMMRILERIKP